MKPIRLTRPARGQAQERGAAESEVLEAVRHGLREPVRMERVLCRYNVAFTRKAGIGTTDGPARPGAAARVWGYGCLGVWAWKRFRR